MTLIFRATTVQDAPALTSFLARSFSVDTSSEFLRPDLLYWKFWATREDCHEPRSYVLERNAEIVAHAGIWPMTVSTRAGAIRGCHAIDWASDPSVPGVGVAIKRRISELFDFVYAIGYSEIAARVLPKMGFEQIGEAWSAARPLRPLRQAMSYQDKNWKSTVRLARNTIWSFIPFHSPCKSWALQEGLNRNETEGEPSEALPCALRSNAYFRYLQKCPTATITVFRIQKDSQDAGHMALSFLHNQTRLVGIWLKHPTVESLSVAYNLGQEAALQTSSSVEIIARGSTSFSARAATNAGLKVRRRQPIYLLCEKRNFPSMPFEFQIGDTDDVFLSDGAPSYWT